MMLVVIRLVSGKAERKFRLNKLTKLKKWKQSFLNVSRMF